MKIIAKGNEHTYTVNHIEFEKDGTIKYIKGYFEWAGVKDYPIGGHADYMDIDRKIKLEVVYDS